MVFIITFSVFLHACNSQLDVEIKQPDALIVVDAWIEKGDQAKVFLTTNAPYFSSIDSASIRDLVLSRAKVTISDGEQSEVLILRKDTRFFPPVYYEGNLIYGDTGKIYTLTAEYGGKSVSSQTTVPAAVKIDTCYFEPLADNDTIGKVILIFTDPEYEKNYYRIFTMRLGEDEKFISSFIIALDDQYFSGQKFSLELSRPPESFLSSSGNEYFTRSDTILVKLCTMDKAAFDFWNTYQDEVINSANPFASSMTGLQSNILGDGLGIWSGYGVTLFTVFGE